MPQLLAYAGNFIAVIVFDVATKLLKRL